MMKNVLDRPVFNGIGLYKKSLAFKEPTLSFFTKLLIFR